jgi:hypothetical protein
LQFAGVIPAFEVAILQNLSGGSAKFVQQTDGYVNGAESKSSINGNVTTGLQ